MVFLPAGDALRVSALHELLKKKNLKAHLTVFWHGPHRARKPIVSPVIEAMFRTLPADIQVDFDTDEEPQARRRG